MFGNSLPSDVERRAMIDRRANEWQAKRDINSFAERKTLDRNHRLVMITRDHGDELSAGSAQEDSVRRNRASNVGVVDCTTRLYGRRDRRCFFKPKRFT